MKSTPAMRARIRELMGREQDDYDRAVKWVLDDIEALEAALRKIEDLVESEDGEPLDDAIRIARAALAPEQER